DVVRQLRDACFDRGLIRATVSLYVEPSSKVHRPDLVELVFRVEPGAPYKVSSVKLRGLPAAAETLKLRLKAGQGYARKELLADVAQLEAVLKKVHAPGPVQVDSVIDDEAKTIDVA